MTQIGRYLVVRELGRGAMGVVYEAQDPLIGRTVAIKTIHMESMGESQGTEWLQERLVREARSSGALSHPGIVVIHDVGRHENLAYIAMERVDGPTLEQALQAGSPSLGEACSILRQTAAALDYAHRAGVIHRDIKPANLMLHHRTTVKITDFGIAKITDTQHHTRTGTILGTPSYMSPEQITGQTLDGRSDQFSLAVIAFEMLAGCKPFTADTLVALVHQIVYQERPSVRQFRPDLPAGVDAVFAKGLARTAAERYPSCEAFVAALEQAVVAPVTVVRPATTVHFPVAPPPVPVAPGPATNVPDTNVPPAPFIAPVVTAPTAWPPPPPIATRTMPPALPRPQGSRWMWPVALGTVALAIVGAALLVMPRPDNGKDKAGDKQGVSDDGGGAAGNGTDGVFLGDGGTDLSGIGIGAIGGNVGGDANARGSGSTNTSKEASKGSRTGTDDGVAGRKENPAPKDPQEPGPAFSGSSEIYEGLVQAAIQASQRNSFEQAMQLLNRAVAMDPGKPRAYDKLGELNLYYLNQTKPALENYQASIARGGTATFHVAHDHANGNFSLNCKGWLYVSKTQVGYQGFDSSHTFMADRSQLREFKRNRVAGVDLKAFHIQMADGRNFNFAPLSRFGQVERDLILSLGGTE